MEKYDKFGKSLPLRTFWREYVNDIDETISYKVWYKFMKKFNGVVIEKTNSIVDKYADKQVNENTLEKNSLKNILKIADFTIEELTENPDLLKKIPPEERMKWLFQSMKARDSRMITVAKVKAEERKTSLYEDMLQGAQYGEIVEIEEEEEEIEATPKKLEEKVVVFNPNNL